MKNSLDFGAIPLQLRLEFAFEISCIFQLYWDLCPHYNRQAGPNWETPVIWPLRVFGEIRRGYNSVPWRNCPFYFMSFFCVMCHGASSFLSGVQWHSNRVCACVGRLRGNII